MCFSISCSECIIIIYSLGYQPIVYILMTRRIEIFLSLKLSLCYYYIAKYSSS